MSGRAWVSETVSERVGQWVSESVSEWVSEWLSESVSQVTVWLHMSKTECAQC